MRKPVAVGRTINALGLMFTGVAKVLVATILCIALGVGILLSQHQLRAWINLNQALDYDHVIAKASSYYCSVRVYALSANAQEQPFAITRHDKDWQPNLRGRPETWTRHEDSWDRTPIDLSGYLLSSSIEPSKEWQCPVPLATYEKIIEASQDNDGWIAYHTSGHGFLLYSAPKKIAVFYSFDP